MKEIKFRAWGKASKKMYFQNFAINPDGTTRTWGIYEHLIPMQYTGLKDKNGKEIYEGDITNNGIIEYCENLNWDGGGSIHPGFYFKDQYEFEHGELAYHVGFDEDIEVIGNIYENPELLGEK